MFVSLECRVQLVAHPTMVFRQCIFLDLVLIGRPELCPASLFFQEARHSGGINLVNPENFACNGRTNDYRVPVCENN